ncbi:MAG: serine hydrolase domain-containing protein [Bacteroidota bacterium]
MNQLRVLGLLLLFLWGIIFTLHAQKPTTFQEAIPELHNEIKDVLAAHRIQGVSIVLTDHQYPLFQYAWGWANEDAQKAVSPETMFRLGSVSKTFTATAVMQLHEQGKIDIYQPINTYLPAFSPLSRFEGARDISVHDLLTHHSGLPSDRLDGFYSKRPKPFQELLQKISETYLSFPPNTCMAYSNLGYSILGILIEEVSGQTYENYIRSHIFEPLGIKDAHFSYKGRDTLSYANGYDFKGRKANEPWMRDVPAVMLQAHSKDMSKWMQYLLKISKGEEGSVIQPSTFAMMVSPSQQKIVLDFDSQMGMGFFLRGPYSPWGFAGGAIQHGGDTRLFHTQMTLLPAKDLGLIIMTNSENGAQACSEIEKIVLLKAMELLRGKKFSKKTKPLYYVHRGSQRSIKELGGTYAFGTMPLNIIPEKNKMVFKMGNKKENMHYEPSYNHYYVNQTFLGIPLRSSEKAYFFREVNGHQVITTLGSNGESLVGIKQQSNPIPEEWEKACGKYWPENAENEYLLQNFSLVKENGFLLIKARLFGQKPVKKLGLNPLSKHAAVVYGLGRNAGDRVEIIQEKGQTILLYSGMRWIKK